MKIGAVTRAGPAAMDPSPAPATCDDPDVLRHLIDLAEGDAGRSRRGADVSLAWWSAESRGGFGPNSLRGVDRAIADPMQTVFGSILCNREDPSRLEEAFEAELRALVWGRRPAPVG